MHERPRPASPLAWAATVLVALLAAGCAGRTTPATVGGGAPSAGHFAAGSRDKGSQAAVLALPPAVGPITTLPAATLPPLGPLVSPDALVTTSAPISPTAYRRLVQVLRPTAAVSVSTGWVRRGAGSLLAVGADPGALRPLTPGATAQSAPLWAAVAAGDVAVAHATARQADITLGGQLGADGVQPLRVGALATTGLPRVDLVVSTATASALRLVAGTGVVLATADHDPGRLAAAVHQVLGAGAEVALVHQPVVTQRAGQLVGSDAMAKVLAAAQSQLGKPYVWGGVGPDSFDCSGLVGFAYRAAGLDLPRTAAQLFEAGPHVRAQDARPGDLLFWANDPADPDVIDHVAIYWGGQQMLEAPHTGDVVKIAQVYGGTFVGVVRVDPRLSARVEGPRYGDFTAR